MKTLSLIENFANSEIDALQTLITYSKYDLLIKPIPFGEKF